MGDREGEGIHRRWKRELEKALERARHLDTNVPPLLYNIRVLKSKSKTKAPKYYKNTLPK